MILYPVFYKRSGIKVEAQLANPVLTNIEKLTLPLGSILHYLPEDTVEYGPGADDYLLREPERPVLVEHIIELTSFKGNPKPTLIASKKFTTLYHHRYRRLRPLRTIEAALREQKNIVVENYAVLNHLYRYVTSFFNDYYTWFNIQATMWGRLEALAKTSDRQHFIQCKLPQTLPALSELNIASKSITRASLEPFNSSAALQILDLWTWLGDNRVNSAMSVLTEPTLDKVNLIWEESGKWFVINLGLLNSWIANKEAKRTGLTSVDVQRRMLRSLMSLFEARTVGASQTPVVVSADVVAVPTDSKTAPVEEKVTDEVKDNNEISDADIEKDLQQLELVSETARLAQAEKDKVTAYTHVDTPLEAGITKRCDELADAGVLSGAEYRRLIKLSDNANTLPDPYGSGKTLSESAKITPDELTVTASTKIPEIDSVFDKSMLQSTLLEFDSRYVDKVLQKDILNAVLYIQKAGIAIGKYEIETIEDAVNKYEAHTIRLIPVSGSPTTIHLKIPVVDEDGIFKANGVKCRLRKQRIDKPIRKSGPGEVALTSYYSKTFISRSERATSNYQSWLINQITAAAYASDTPTVTDLIFNNVFISDSKIPRIYSILASRFQSFKSGKYDFYLHYDKRFDVFGEAAVKAVEGKGLVVIGKSGAKLVVVDISDTFYLATGAELEVIGKIDSLVEVDSFKAPLEFCEIKVFGKAVPVGIFLAYELGLEKLIKTLGVEPRRVPRSERANVGPDEYSLTFDDEVLIFPRENRKASIILAGIAQYREYIKNYSVYDFDKKDVYFNILESNGLGIRYIREMDLMTKMFVDHITEELLLEMKEPTDFIGLLFRSAELLLTDWHPDEIDMDYMRIRGYERFAGSVYTELVKSLRMYNARPASSGAVIDVSPHAVWGAITQDAGVALVEESNPIHNLKEIEVVTFGGTGGRSSRSMVRKSRVFGKSDVGVISEATVDSSDVGIVTYLTADPKFNSLRGTSERVDFKKDGLTSILSSSALLAAAITNDD